MDVGGEAKSSADIEVCGGGGGGGGAAAVAAATQSKAPSDLPGLVVTFQHLTYRVPSSQRRKEWATLLSDVTAYLAPGQMTAILGPSGSGKTTLLDLLSARKTVGQLAPESTILYAGRRASAAFLRRHVGYVEQHDTLLINLTVYEMLLYTARLKHPLREPLATQLAQVEELIDKLNLEACRDTVIGSAMSRGVSGGEAKRTNIGIALITSPRILFLDEVTSGLDSYNAHSVIRVVKDLVHDDITICATIHSPPPYTFELFDRVLVLQRGRVAYFGGNGEPALRYFRDTFPSLRAPLHSEGVADLLVDVTTQASKLQGAAPSGPATAFAEAYEASPLRAECDAQIEEYLGAARQLSPQVTFRIDGERSAHSGANGSGFWRPTFARPEGTVTPFWWGLLMLWRYRSLANFRRMDYIAPRVFDKAAMVFIMCTLYWAVGKDLDPSTVITQAAILFMWAVLTAYGAMGILPLLIMERPVYLRERADGLYRPITYLVFKFTEELLAASLASVPYSVLTFYLVRLEGSFLLFFLVYVVSIAIAIALALLGGALFSQVDVAGAALPAYTSTLLYFSGFFIPFNQIPGYWKWYAIINYLRYSWGALMVNQFSGPNNIVAFGQTQVLEYYSLENVDKWAWLGWETLFVLVFLLMAWVALVALQHQKR